MKTTVNERIKMLRNHLNLTQQEFASIVELTSTQLSRIENGNGEPQKSTIQQIIKNIDVAPTWLIEGKGELKAQVKEKNASISNDPWKDALVMQVKEENTRLQRELERVWQMVQHLTGGAKPNFLKALDKAGFSVYLPGKSSRVKAAA